MRTYGFVSYATPQVKWEGAYLRNGDRKKACYGITRTRNARKKKTPSPSPSLFVGTAVGVEEELTCEK